MHCYLIFCVFGNYINRKMKPKHEFLERKNSLITVTLALLVNRKMNLLFNLVNTVNYL